MALDIELQYLHGFNSAALDEDAKVVELRRRFAVRLINYNSFAPRDAIIEQIEAAMGSQGPMAFIGTSLGGYYAAVMGRRHGCPSIMINPSTDPHWGLSHYLDQWLPNPKLPDLPPRRLTPEAVASYAGRELSPDPNDYAIAPMLIVDRADELLDAGTTLRDYGGLGDPLAFEGGSHRFEHMAEARGPIQDYLSHR